jgi:hypothetical protein
VIAATHRKTLSFALWVGLVLGGGGCGSSRVPDPRAAVTAYAEAALRGDSNAIYGMMTTRAQKALSPDDVRKLIQAERPELADQATALRSSDARLTARARLRFSDGEEVALDLERGRFGVSSAGTLPGGSATPQGALDELRRVVARRSYPGLLRLLSPATRSAVEQDLRALVSGLEHPETLHVEVHGEDATVEVPFGHKVRLKRQGGLWWVDDFD